MFRSLGDRWSGLAPIFALCAAIFITVGIYQSFKTHGDTNIAYGAFAVAALFTFQAVVGLQARWSEKRDK